MDNETEYTQQEFIVFEDGDGAEVSMSIVDEFDMDGVHYVALVEADEPDESDDLISYFAVTTDENGEEDFELVEDDVLGEKLADTLEQRLIEKADGETRE